MPSKLQSYTQMDEQVAAGLTGSYQRWTAFLTTAARLYKYPFPEQMMIFAQRPDATACAQYDFWNNTMGRYVRRDSKGIALKERKPDRQAHRHCCPAQSLRQTPATRSLRLISPGELDTIQTSVSFDKGTES